MEFHLEHQIRLSEESEYKNLYSWFLQEFSKKDGKPAGRPLIPWQWRLYFRAIEIRYSKEIELESEPDEPDPDDEPARDVIHATLQPAPNWKKPTHFSMLGTDRTIKDFSLSIRRLKDDQGAEQCRIWGIVSYTSEVDFEHSTTVDSICVDVVLNPQHFDELRYLVENGRENDELAVGLAGVAGFYSEWSPSIRTNDIKVLTGYDEDQPLIVPDGCAVKPPRLGEVQRFSLTFNRRNAIAAPQGAESTPREAENTDEDPPSKVVSTPEQQLQATTLQVLMRVLESVNQSRLALWVTAALVAALLVFK